MKTRGLAVIGWALAFTTAACTGAIDAVEPGAAGNTDGGQLDNTPVTTNGQTRSGRHRAGTGGSSDGPTSSAGGAAGGHVDAGAATETAVPGVDAGSTGGARDSGTSAGGKTGTGAGGSVVTGAGGKTGSGGAVGTSAGGSVGTSSGGATGTTGSGGASGAVVTANLCKGLISDKLAHPMTTIAKPAVGASIVDAEFGTRIRRVTGVGGTGAIVPLYSTVSAWNADESRFILFNIAGEHQLYDGKTYQLIRSLAEINPADVEQVYWHTTDPDIFFYVDGKNFIRYHVGTAVRETVTTFSFCTANASGGSDPMFTSFDSRRIGLVCGTQVFIYDISTNVVIARQTILENPAQVSPSGNLAYLSDSGRVTDANLNVLRTLDLKEPFGHASMGRLPTGEDTWNGQVFDDGPGGNSDIGSLVTFDLTTGTSHVVIGPKTGFPYPPDGHVSAMAYKQPGWIVVSTFGNTTAAGLLDQEIVYANTVTGAFCRAGRHRAWGKDNTHLSEPYWAEAHTVPSPSGTRAIFASDWSNGVSVDTYVLELPSYVP